MMSPVRQNDVFGQLGSFSSFSNFKCLKLIVGRRRSRREVPEGMLLSVNVDPNFDVMIV